jgi:hypothetical protein
VEGCGFCRSKDTTEEMKKTFNRNGWVSDRDMNRVPHHWKAHAA